MLIALDIGNTHIDFGLFSDGALLARDRIRTPDPAGVTDHAIWLMDFIAKHANHQPVERALIAAVVRDIETDLIAACNRCDIAAHSVDSDWDLGLQIRYDNPQHVGIDRLLAASAALAEAPPDTALIIADAGTAITVDLLSAEGIYLGGTIAPGLQMMLKSLRAGTSLLPEIELGDRASLPATNTPDGMRAGILFGAASLIDGLRDRLGEIAGTPVQSILTGGDAQRLYPLTRSNWQCDSTLVLRGLCVAYERNKLTV